MSTAKIFWSGQSQAVRLPKAFRFDTDTVQIRRCGNAIILEPIADNWAWLDAIAEKIDNDFASAVSEKQEAQGRPTLDNLFK